MQATEATEVKVQYAELPNTTTRLVTKTTSLVTTQFGSFSCATIGLHSLFKLLHVQVTINYNYMLVILLQS